MPAVVDLITTYCLNVEEVVLTPAVYDETTLLRHMSHIIQNCKSLCKLKMSMPLRYELEYTRSQNNTIRFDISSNVVVLNEYWSDFFSHVAVDDLIFFHIKTKPLLMLDVIHISLPKLKRLQFYNCYDAYDVTRYKNILTHCHELKYVSIDDPYTINQLKQLHCDSGVEFSEKLKFLQ